MNQCNNCGGAIISDYEGKAPHCENANTALFWDKDPEGEPVECTLTGLQQEILHELEEEEYRKGFSFIMYQYCTQGKSLSSLAKVGLVVAERNNTSSYHIQGIADACEYIETYLDSQPHGEFTADTSDIPHLNKQAQ